MDLPFVYDDGGNTFDDDVAEFAHELSRPMASRGGGRGGGARGRRRVVASVSTSASTSTATGDDAPESEPATSTTPTPFRNSSSFSTADVPFSQRVYLSVPFDQKDDAKKRGAKWDPAKKKWWISNDKATADVIEKWGGGSTTRTDPVVAPKEDTPRARSDTTLRGWFDGGSRGNPGHCGFGSILRAGNGSVLGIRIGGWQKGTNNEAEYAGCCELLQLILEALREAPSGSLSGRRVEIRGDSKMVIQQLKGEWDCHAENLTRVSEKCKTLLKEIRTLISPDGEIVIEHVLREYNKEADALSNIGMDQVTPPSR